MPTLTDIQSVSAYMDNVPVEKQLKEALGEINEDDEYIIFTDMLGGSVNQGKQSNTYSILMYM